MDIQERYKHMVQGDTDLFIKKNTDYGNSVFMPVLDIPTLKCIWVRCTDKIRRIENLLKGHDALVVWESLNDTLRDLSVYCNLMRISPDFEKLQQSGKRLASDVLKEFEEARKENPSYGYDNALEDASGINPMLRSCAHSQKGECYSCRANKEQYEEEAAQMQKQSPTMFSVVNAEEFEKIELSGCQFCSCRAFTPNRGRDKNIKDTMSIRFCICGHGEGVHNPSNAEVGAV